MKLDESTTIVFTSDNGGVASGDNFSTSNLPLRGGKGYPWEGGIRIPYFIYVPWAKHKGIKNSTPVSGVDLYPTILELSGIPLKPNEHTDGVSLMPILTGKTIESRPLFWHYPHYGNQGGEPHSIVREGDWKLIHYWEDGRDELYNLQTDIGERNNLTDVHPEISSQMSRKLLNWLDKMDAKYPALDSLRNEESARIVLEGYKKELLPKLEIKRQQMMKSNWRPNEDWWGSKITKD